MSSFTVALLFIRIAKHFSHLGQDNFSSRRSARILVLNPDQRLTSVSSPGLFALSSDSGRLGAERPRRIFPMSTTSDVTFDYVSRKTGNEADFTQKRMNSSRYLHRTQYKPCSNTSLGVTVALTSRYCSRIVLLVVRALIQATTALWKKSFLYTYVVD